MSTGSFSTATELDALQSYLDEMRHVLVRKVGGLSERDARRASTVSSLSLLAILKHCAVWERRWFQVVFAGRPDPEGWPAVRGKPDGTFALGDDDTVEGVLADYRAQVDASRDILAAGDLDARCALSDLVDENLRWVAMHMIQETARHAGHADIIREAIDGSRGYRAIRTAASTSAICRARMTSSSNADPGALVGRAEGVGMSTATGARWPSSVASRGGRATCSSRRRRTSRTSSLWTWRSI
jgi:hypothetical protein